MMKAKKLLIALIILMVFMGSLSSPVYASVLDISEKQASTDISLDMVKDEETIAATIQETETSKEGSIKEKIETTSQDEAILAEEEGKTTKNSEKNIKVEVEEESQKVDTKVEEEKKKTTKSKKESTTKAVKSTSEDKRANKSKSTKTSNTSNAKSTKTSNTAKSKLTKKTTKKEVKKPAYSQEDLKLLTCLVYTEAGNQPYEGMLGVANVVLNRKKSKIFNHANTVKEVIYDRKWCVQFSVTIKNKKSGLSAMDRALKSYSSGKFSGSNQAAQKKAMERAKKAAKAALEGENNIGSYLCFSNKSCEKTVKKKYSKYLIIKDTIFYRSK